MLNMKKIKVRKRHFERVTIIFFTLSKFLRINLGTFFQWVLFTYIHKPIYLARILYFKRNSVPYLSYFLITIDMFLFCAWYILVDIVDLTSFCVFFSFWDIYIHKKKVYKRDLYAFDTHKIQYRIGKQCKKKLCLFKKVERKYKSCVLISF